MTTRQLKISTYTPESKIKYIYVNNVNTTITHEKCREFAMKTVQLTESTYVSTSIIETTTID